MSEKTEIQSTSKESVALEIALRISKAEGLKFEDPQYRNKFLNLYSECLKATNGFRETE